MASSSGTSTVRARHKGRRGLSRASTASELSVMSIDPEGSDDDDEQEDTDMSTISRRLSMRSTTSTRSSRPMPMSVSTTTAKRQSKSVLALNVAEPEDVDYLIESTKPEHSDLHMGFGRGFILRPPDDWEPSRRARFRHLCTTLGFKTEIVRSKLCFQMSNTLVSSLVCPRLLTLITCDNQIWHNWLCNFQIAKLRRELRDFRSSAAPPTEIKRSLAKPSSSNDSASTACVLRLEEIMSSESSPNERPPRSRTKKRSSFVLSPSAFAALEDSSPSPTDVPGPRLSLTACRESPVPHQNDEQAPQATGDPMLDDMALSFKALALGPDSAAQQPRASNGSDETGRQSAHLQEDSFFSDAGHDGDQPFEIRTISECVAHEDQQHLLSYPLDSPPQTAKNPPVQSSGSSHSCSNRVSTESIVTTFETPTVIKRQARPIPGEHDWGISLPASRHILEILTRRLDNYVENARDSLDLTMMERVKIRESNESLLPPPHMRYATNVRMSIDKGFAFDSFQAGPSIPGRKSGKYAELRRKQSVAKARRISIGLQARAAHHFPARPRPTRGLSLAPVRDDSPGTRSSFDSDSSSPAVVSRAIAPNITSEPSSIRALDCQMLARVFNYLSPHEVITVLPFICKEWIEPAIHARANVLSDLNCLSQGLQREWDWLMTSLPCGVFLSDGAYKSVFKVNC